MRTHVPFAILITALVPPAHPQPSAPRSFEVASVKLHQASSGGRIGFTTSGPRFDANAELLTNLIAYAYNIKRFQVADSPALRPLADEFYDIVAVAEGGKAPPTADFRAALQLLLADRFHLAVHFEKRDLPVYALVIGKNGPKLRKPGPAADPPPARAVRYSEAGRNWRAASDRATMDDLLLAVENSLLDRPVIDRTGITAPFGFELEFTPQTPPNRRNPEPDDVLIFEALERQLGLRLEAQKAPFDMLVVDHAEPPTAN
jgi:uncharacterized protein (TIGR03435 family)